ncbi:hypothetical protein FOZ63_029511, partial [Perkinsus olseni]
LRSYFINALHDKLRVVAKTTYPHIQDPIAMAQHLDMFLNEQDNPPQYLSPTQSRRLEFPSWKIILDTGCTDTLINKKFANTLVKELPDVIITNHYASFQTISEGDDISSHHKLSAQIPISDIEGCEYYTTKINDISSVGKLNGPIDYPPSPPGHVVVDTVMTSPWLETTVRKKDDDDDTSPKWFHIDLSNQATSLAFKQQFRRVPEYYWRMKMTTEGGKQQVQQKLDGFIDNDMMESVDNDSRNVFT